MMGTPILPTLATILGVLLNLILSAFQSSVILLSKLGIIEVSLPNVSVPFILTCYLLLGLIFFTPQFWFRTRKVIVASSKIASGEKLTTQVLREREFPAAMLPAEISATARAIVRTIVGFMRGLR